MLLRNDIYIYIESNAYIRYFALIRNSISNNYVLSGNIINLFFVLLCNYSMTELIIKLNAALEHSVTLTYQKGEMAIRAHEKIGMGEVKIHSVLLRDQLILRLLPFWPCCCGIDCFGSTFFLALG